MRYWMVDAADAETNGEESDDERDEASDDDDP
jgi:hypothetical protein